MNRCPFDRAHRCAMSDGDLCYQEWPCDRRTPMAQPNKRPFRPEDLNARTLKDFLRHMTTVFGHIRHLGTSVPPTVYNAYRMARREHARLIKNLEE